MGDTIARESLIFELKEVQSYLRGIGEYRKANMIDFALGYVESPAREQLNIAKAALEYYADHRSYAILNHDEYLEGEFAEYEIFNDGGERARKALSQINGKGDRADD